MLSHKKRLILFIGLISCTSILADVGPYDEAAFNACSQLTKDYYQNLRDFLLLRGKKLLPLLAKKEKSPDFNQRKLAQILKLYIEKPDFVKDWKEKLADKNLFKTKGKLLEYKYSPIYKQRVLMLNEEHLPSKGKGIPIPLQIDVIWEGDPSHNQSFLNVMIEFALSPQEEVVEAGIGMGAYSTKITLPKITEIDMSSYVTEPLMKMGLLNLRKNARTKTILKNILLKANTTLKINSDVLMAVYALSRFENKDIIPPLLGLLQNKVFFRDDGYPPKHYELRNLISNAEFEKGNIDTDKSALESFLEAVTYLKSDKALPTVIDLFVLAARQKRRNDRNGISYEMIGDLIVNRYGEKAEAYLTRRLAEKGFAGDKIVIQNLLYKIQGVKNKTAEIAALKEEIWFNESPELLLELHQLSGENIQKRLERLANNYDHPDQRLAALLVMGETKNIEAIPFLTKYIKEQHSYIDSCLEGYSLRLGFSDKANAEYLAERKRETRKELQKMWRIRVEGSGFASGNKKLLDRLCRGDAGILAMRGIGGKKAEKALQKIADHPEFNVRAESSLLYLKKDKRTLLKRLENKIPQIREEAALALLDLRVQDPKISKELICAAARRSFPNYRQWEKYALQSQKNIRPVLRKLSKEGNTREKVMARYVLAKIDTPEKVDLYHRILNSRAGSIGILEVWRIGDIEVGGKNLVALKGKTPPVKKILSDFRNIEKNKDFGSFKKYEQFPSVKLDETYLPMLEFTAVFGQGILRRGLAAYAVAEFKKKASMPVLVEAFNMGSLGGSNPAALALTAFGEEGARLAAKVPPPVPGQLDTGIRMTQSRAGVRVLAENKDVKGVDEILKGLNTLIKDRKLSRWSYRADIYMSAAEKYHDKRLIKPLITILNIRKSPFDYTHKTIIKLLAKYDDPRLPKLFLRELALKKKYSGLYHNDACKVAATELTRLLGQKTIDFLIDSYKQTEDVNLKCGMLEIMAGLSYDNDKYPYLRKCEWACSQVNAKEYAAEMREKAFVLFCRELKSPEPKIRKNAALALALWGNGRSEQIDVLKNISKQICLDKRAVAPLNELFKLYPDMISELILDYTMNEYLSHCENTVTADLCFEQLKKNPKHFGGRDIIATLQAKGSLEFFKSLFYTYYHQQLEKGQVDDWEKKKYWKKYVDTIAKYGDDGGKLLCEMLQDVQGLPPKEVIISAIDKMKYRPGAAGIADFTIKLVKQGMDNPKLGKIPSKREDRFTWPLYAYTRTVEKLDPDIARKLAEQILLSDVPPETKVWAYRVYIGKKNKWIDYTY